MNTQLVIAVGAWLCLGGVATAQGTPETGLCDRECLIGVAEQYLDALVAKDSKKVPVTVNVKYTENGQRLRLGDGFWNSVSGRGTYTLPRRRHRGGAGGHVCHDA